MRGNMISQELVTELGSILQQDLGLSLPRSVVTETANFLVSFFEILIQYEHKHNINRDH